MSCLLQVQVQAEELCARSAKLLDMQELFSVRSRRLCRAELGADVFGLTERWESDLGVSCKPWEGNAQDLPGR